jgi:hypothetical protein
VEDQKKGMRSAERDRLEQAHAIHLDNLNHELKRQKMKHDAELTDMLERHNHARAVSEAGLRQHAYHAGKR